MLLQLEEADPNGKHPTAHAVLCWFQELTAVFPQNMAAMFVLFPERANSAIGRMPALGMVEFQVRLGVAGMRLQLID